MAKGETVELQITRACVVAGKDCEAGTRVSVSRSDAALLMGNNQAVPAGKQRRGRGRGEDAGDGGGDEE